VEIKTVNLLREWFRHYYNRYGEGLAPPNAEMREFAHIPFTTEDHTLMSRHQTLKKDEIARFLAEKSPRHVYYSTAYYKTPGAPTMEGKTWLGADLTFDLDADHLEVPCKKEHDRWRCPKCNKTGWGKKPGRCPTCGNPGLEENTWICDKCLGLVANETTRIIEEFLIPDFGFSKNEIAVNFSGRRGYHIHIYNKAVRQLDQRARREIVDYITARGLEPKLHGIPPIPGSHGPLETDPGWRGRLASCAKGELEKELARHGLKPSDDLWRRISEGYWDQFKGWGEKKWRDIAVRGSSLRSGKTDEPVTTDIKRLIRLPNSLHGGSGFKVCPVRDPTEFDPLKDSLVFPMSKTVEIKIFEHAPPIRIADDTYGPYSPGEELELPLGAAIFYLCNEVAEVVSGV